MSYRTEIDAAERAAARYTLAVPRRSAPIGRHLGGGGGSSLDFQEHREYQPGDDLRHLDWSAYARSDRLVVKLFHEEVQPHFDLLLDGSRSMALDGSSKAAAAAGLVALLARAAARAGLTCGVWLAAEGCRRLAGASGGPASFEDAAASASLRDLEFQHRGNPRQSLDRLPPRWRPRGIRLLLSDLLWDDEPRAVLARMARGSAAVWVVQLLASADVDPASAGWPAPEGGQIGNFCRLEDSETGHTRALLLDAAAIERYRRALTAHRAGWHRACREAGAMMVTMVAERLVDGWKPEALEELVRSGMLEVA